MDENFLQEIERARRMTPDERLRESLRLIEQGHDYIVRSLEEAFPEMPRDDVQRIRDRVIRQCKR